MACSCSSRKGTAMTSYVVVAPGGKKKSYSSRVAAEAYIAQTPGAYLVPPQPVSS